MARQTFTAGQTLTAVQMTQLQANAGYNLDFNPQTGTTYTLVLADAGKLVSLTNASSITLTIPTNTSVAFSIGDQVNLYQGGTGQVTVAGAGGVTLRSQGSKTKMFGQYSLATLLKIGTDEWVLLGNTAA
jgi:Tfp pilus assembly protein PilW